MSSDPVVLAVDIGGTSLKGAIVDASGRLLHQEAAHVGHLQGEAIFDQLRELLDRLRKESESRGLSAQAAALIAPGMDEANGRVMFASNLGWRDLPLRDRLEPHLALPVATGHDVRTAGIAEGRFGAARGARDFAMVMLGTGIAAALVANGQAISGARGMGGEFGHMPVIPNGEACPCGQRGCLEAYASAGAVVRRYRAAGGNPGLTARQIVDAADADALCARIWREAIEALGHGLATLTMLLDPALIVIGGGLAEAGARLFEPLRDALRSGLAWRDPPPLVASALGSAGALYGAAAIGFERIGMGDAVPQWRIG
jgi:glucokinase